MSIIQWSVVLPVVGGLVRALDRDIKVLGLLSSECRQLHIQLSKVSTGNLFVQFLRQYVHTNGKFSGIRPQGNLRQDLIGK